MSGFEILAGIGTALSAGGMVLGGVADKRAADFEAAQLRSRAKEEVAASQRDAIAKRREGSIINSRAQALAAASGGGAGYDAPTIVKLMSDTAGEAEYNAGTSMYGGYSRAAGLRDQARARKMSGRASLLGSTIGAFGTAASGFGNIGLNRK